MTTIYLYDKNKKPILGSDGAMYVDGRKRFAPQIMERNARYKRNFPHKVASYYSVSSGREHYNPNFKPQLIPTI